MLYICLIPRAKVLIETIVKDGVNETIERFNVPPANLSRYSTFSVKNAASILGRLVHDPQIIERFRKLREMKMLKVIFA